MLLVVDMVTCQGYRRIVKAGSAGRISLELVILSVADGIAEVDQKLRQASLRRRIIA